MVKCTELEIGCSKAYSRKHVTDKEIHAVREEVFNEYCTRDDSV